MSFDKENEERRKRELISENIIKRSSVNNTNEIFYVGSPDNIDGYSGKPIYLQPKNHTEEIEEDVYDSNGMSEEDLNTANEIYQRLMAEAAADEAAKQAEIDAIKRQQEKTSDISVYSSGSPSANYGSKPMSQSDSDAFDSIMNNNRSFNKSIEDLIAENQ